MHMNMIVNEPPVKTIKPQSTMLIIAVFCLKSQATSHGDIMEAFLGCYLPIQLPLKLLLSVHDVTWFHHVATDSKSA